MKQPLIPCLAIVAAALVGCGDQPTTPSPTVSLSAGALRQIKEAQSGRNSRGFEDDILRIEGAAPGFGGMFVDGTGQVTAYVTRLADSAATRGALRSMAARLHVTAELRGHLASSGRVHFKQARYSFSQLADWKSAAARAVAGRPGVRSFDADEARNVVRVGIDSDADATEIEYLVARAGVPAEAIAVVLLPGGGLLTSIRETWRPTEAGTQIMNTSYNGSTIGGVCSMGFNVTTAGLNESGFLTAAHCDRSTWGSGFLNESLYQPFKTSPYVVGTTYINNVFNLTDPACNGATKCAAADVLFNRYTNSSISARRVTRTASVGTNSAGGSISHVGYWSNPTVFIGSFVGMNVDKVGRSTGWTRGNVTNTCEDFSPAPGYMFLCSIRVENAAAGQGDSGAPVFYPPVGPDPLYAMGIVFAGGPLSGPGSGYDGPGGGYAFCNAGCFYYYSPWSNIESHLGRTFVP